ncbi:MAG: FkbM family methyltransferase, partial [Methylocapsa sp.]|nr:FkbM family methyltransferase [Methylocapsa sp.]
GWHCINIDPTPGSKRIFDKVRPRDTNLQLAVSQTDGQGYFYMVGQQPSVWNTLDRDAAASVAQKTGMEAKTIVIEQRRLETILDCHLKGRSFELLAIDAEGYDIEILKSNNFARFAPRVILIEVFLPSLEAIAASEVYAYLTRAGYTLYSWLNPNLMFVRNDSLDWEDASQIQLLPAGQLA